MVVIVMKKLNQEHVSSIVYSINFSGPSLISKIKNELIDLIADGYRNISSNWKISLI